MIINDSVDYSNLSMDDIQIMLESKKKKAIDKTKKDEEEEETKAHEEKNTNSKKLNDDHIPVIYAKHKQKEHHCIFKHILVFTNNKDPKDNKTLKEIMDAIKVLPEKPELHIFNTAHVDMDDMEREINISDGTEEFTINKESNLDTLIFSRLTVQDNDECAHAVQVLQDRGFLVLNPVKYTEVASNKYDSACLFEKGEIPQPRFCLMTKEILYDEKQFNENIRDIYPKYDPDNKDAAEKMEVVIKILDGHGGTGVMALNCKNMISVLQCIFAIDPERQLIIQKKEESAGGDIRVHVLTLRNKQIILAAMKRDQIKGDFRSNVSLGAEAEGVKLTPEQEQIALKTAMLSKLPWCGVDIMSLKPGTNDEGMLNVVLEINASPGTAGISEVIGENFINILLDNLDDPSEFMLQNKAAGYIETASVKFGDGIEKKFLAKLDTGNSTTASMLEVGEYTIKGKNITFNIDGKEVTFKIIANSRARAGEELYTRPVIMVPEITLGLRKLNNVRIAIVKHRENKTTNMLLNRDTLSRLGYMVDPATSHILTDEMEKVKII